MANTNITEQILNSSIVLEIICKNLNLKEHLKLIRVCEEFRDTLVHIVWRSMCKELILTERNDNYLIQTNEADVCVKELQFFEFMNLNKFNIHQLQLRNCAHIKLFDVLQKFQNLTHLEFQYCKISNVNLDLIAANCLALHTLILDRCVQSCNTEVTLGRDIHVETLAKFPSLKALSLFNRYKVKMNYETVHEILKKLHLSKLMVNTTIICEGLKIKCDDDGSNFGESCHSLNHLSIGRFSNRNSWSAFMKLHLPHFRNLQTLSIFIDLANCVLINDAVVKTISESCPFLCELSFKQCKFQVEQFFLPQTLKLLSLEWCWGLTWRNFKQILSDIQLQSYVSINCHYNGDDKDLFYTCESLKTIVLETSLIKDLVAILRNSKSLFPNVISLNWLNSNESCHTQPQEIRQKLSQIFPNLQYLQLQQSYLPCSELKKLHSLKILQFSLFDYMTWSYVLTLLESSSLTHLTIDMPTDVTAAVCPILNAKPYKLSNTPLNLRTIVEYLKIPLELFQKGLCFWLDLLQRNRKLQLMFYNNYSYKIFNQKFLCDLLHNEKFPQDLKTINICNKHVDCNAVRKSSAKNLDRLEFSCNSSGQYFIVI